MSVLNCNGKPMWLVLGVFIAAGTAHAEEWSIEDAQVGDLPAGWSAAKTWDGAGSVSSALENQLAPGGSQVLAQTSPDEPNELFNVCVCPKSTEIRSFCDPRSAGV